MRTGIAEIFVNADKRDGFENPKRWREEAEAAVVAREKIEPIACFTEAMKKFTFGIPSYQSPPDIRIELLPEDVWPKFRVTLHDAIGDPYRSAVYRDHMISSVHDALIILHTLYSLWVNPEIMHDYWEGNYSRARKAATD